MILEEATKDTFGHYPKDLKPQSNKRILAACDECGKVRSIKKSGYHALCLSCARKGNKNSLGNTNALGSKRTDEQNAKNSTAQKGIINTMDTNA